MGIPFQRLLDKRGGTHGFLVSQGIRILENDGWAELSRFYSENIEVITRGCYWADSTWKNAAHHYDPDTGKGLWIWPGAKDQCRDWFNLSLKFISSGNLEKALFFLGASVHTVQDACQPYHSNCVCLNGHQKYEIWADQHKEEFAVTSNGLYNLSPTAEGWVMENAIFSKPFLSRVSMKRGSDALNRDEHELREATRVLLSRAQRTTAGFFVFFLEEAAKLQEPSGAGGNFHLNAGDLLCRRTPN